MRKKIDVSPSFPLVVTNCELKIVADYQKKYDRISELLDVNPGILNAFHVDLRNWGSDDGRESSYSSEHFLRMLIVKCLEGLSFRDVVVRVSDSAILRNFTRLFSGDVMNFTVLNTAFKLVSPTTWDTIKDLLFRYARSERKISGDRLRLDSTVCESNIHYPTDTSLLWDSFRTAERLMGQCREADVRLDMGNRFHVAKIKKLYTFIATHGGQKRRGTQRKVRAFTRTLVERTDWVCGVSRDFIAHGETVSTGIEACALLTELKRVLPLMEHVVLQARRAFSGETVPASERIFSIFEPHTELLMRGKAHKPVEFGHMVSIGQTVEKFISFCRVEEKSRHDRVIGDEAREDHRKKFGVYPTEFTADKNYYGGPEHTEKWEERIKVYSVGKKGKRNEQETEREHSYLFKLLQKFRAGCEGSISVLKRVFGLRRCLNRGFTSFASAIGCLVFCHNLVVLSKL
jgi:transposase, IS5 family